VSTAAPCGRMFAEHDEGGGGQLGPPRHVRAATGSLVDAFQPRIRELLRPVSADAGDGESRSGSARRSDSLIEFVKTSGGALAVADLDCDNRYRRAELRAERHCDGWFLDRLELEVDRRGAVG
jgi:hypothetical protein